MINLEIGRQDKTRDPHMLNERRGLRHRIQAQIAPVIHDHNIQYIEE